MTPFAPKNTVGFEAKVWNDVWIRPIIPISYGNLYRINYAKAL